MHAKCFKSSSHKHSLFAEPQRHRVLPDTMHMRLCFYSWLASSEFMDTASACRGRGSTGPRSEETGPFLFPTNEEGVPYIRGHSFASIFRKTRVLHTGLLGLVIMTFTKSNLATTCKLKQSRIRVPHKNACREGGVRNDAVQEEAGSWTCMP